jgi:hypothetical protein
MSTTSSPSPSERRYSDHEAATIFREAAELQQAVLRSQSSNQGSLASDGMTLAQLQEIGREVGIPGELVAHAAGSLDRKGRSWVRRFLGLPLGVGQTVSLERTLSDGEWERLVVDLRETFDARGRQRSEGAFRQWTNGNLQALLEPTPSGHQLRLRTLKGDAYVQMTAGLSVVVFAGLLATLRLITVGGVPTGPVGVLTAAGLAMFAIGAVRIPGWARTRREQMREIIDRLNGPETRPD